MTSRMRLSVQIFAINKTSICSKRRGDKAALWSITGLADKTNTTIPGAEKTRIGPTVGFVIYCCRSATRVEGWWGLENRSLLETDKSRDLGVFARTNDTRLFLVVFVPRFYCFRSVFKRTSYRGKDAAWMRCVHKSRCLLYVVTRQRQSLYMMHKADTRQVLFSCLYDVSVAHLSVVCL